MITLAKDIEFLSAFLFGFYVATLAAYVGSAAAFALV